MATVGDVFGKITPPVKGVGGANTADSLARLISGGINIFLIVAGVIGLVYMLWGALSWVTSSGDKERLQKAQGRIRSAVVGIFLTIVVLVIFNTIFAIVFKDAGIITPDSNGGFEFKIPTL